jgi:hypothetical protein
MATQLYFSRDTKVYVEFDSKVWELPVLDGFSFSQANNTSEITLNEMESSAGVSRRGRRAFNDSLAPGEWSLSTYVRPFTSAGSGNGAADGAAETHAVEEVLWAMMAGADNYDPATYDFDRGGNNVITPASSSSAVSFDQSNKSTLGTANIYFVMGDANRTVIKLKDAVVNEASLDFEIDGIATISWSGQCSEVIDFTANTIEANTLPSNGDNTIGAVAVAVGDVWLDSNDSHRLYVMTNIASSSEASTTYPINEKTADTSNFIRNRLTTLTVNGTNTTGLQSSYDLTLTGGNVTISNNVSFITPEEIGLVNIPVGHVTGTRSVSGSFTCYMSVDTTQRGGAGNLSRDLFDDLRALTTTVTNNVGLTFSIGGSSGNRLEVVCATAHLEIPTHSIEDVISLETNFSALPQTIDDTDEVTLTYRV